MLALLESHVSVCVLSVFSLVFFIFLSFNCFYSWSFLFFFLSFYWFSLVINSKMKEKDAHSLWKLMMQDLQAEAPDCQTTVKVSVYLYCSTLACPGLACSIADRRGLSRFGCIPFVGKSVIRGQ